MERAKVLGNNPVVEKGRNLREDIRERWETTENPTVQRFQVCHAFCCCGTRQVHCQQADNNAKRPQLQLCWPHM